MQEPNLCKRESFVWAFEDELIKSLFVEIEPDDEESNTYPNRFNWHISGFKLEEIRALKNEIYIPLFEAALLIGDRMGGNMHWFIHDAPLIFAIAFEQGEIDPREPKCHMPYSKIQHLPDWEEYVINGRFKAPDATWAITPKEAAEFAILKGYPEHLFTDLLSGIPAASTKAESSQSSQELKETERLKLLRIIGLLAETIADSNPCDLRNKDGSIVIGNGEKGTENKTNLLFEIFETLEKLNLEKTYGLGKSTLRDAIEKGIKVLRDN